MTSARQVRSAADWFERIDGLSGERCDLEMLLTDQWRHRVAVRDEPGCPVADAQRTVTVDGEDHAALSALAEDTSVAAVALTVLHTVLHAYGHGHRTVLAHLDVTGARDPRAAEVLPVLADHQGWAGESARAVVEGVDEGVGERDHYLVARDVLHRGLFDALLVLSDRPLSGDDLPPAPLVVVVHDDRAARRLHWTLHYTAELFAADIVDGVLAVTTQVLRQLVAHPSTPLGDVTLLPAEQELLLHSWNGPVGDFPDTVRLDELFEQVAERAPERVAVLCGDTSLTYREVDERSNLVANRLLADPVRVRRGDLVGMHLDKSELGVSATFGIWRTGAAYVPIDPGYPAERVRFLVADTGLGVIVANRHHIDALREVLGPAHADVTLLAVEDLVAPPAADADALRAHPRLTLSSGDRAYVTYTSGTTGVPKGVPKFHSSVVNSITDLAERYDMLRPGTERVALFASYVFEPHLRQTLIALLNEQTLVVVPDDVRLDPDRFPDYLREHGVTYLNATGSVLQHFDLSRCPDLRRLLLVGEELTGPRLRALRAGFGGWIVNEYAFTEAAFVTAIKEFAPGVSDRPDRSIGRPVRNVSWYVLSQDLKQLPIGAIGELYIGGRGVAPGYLNRDDLTAERFTANPYQSEQDARRGQNDRLYRTGDLARVLPGGEVEFMGRADFQLKINGVRIEPGEIEARATEYPGVRSCTVVARDSAAGDRHLVGFYTVADGADVTEEHLLAHLEQRLIRIMVPARMVRMTSIPTNVNGKVDWRALPEVDTATVATGSPDAAPDAVAGLAAELREVWAEVLGVPAQRIGVDDDFFRLGGQSISCVLLIARVRRRWGVSVGVRDVFGARTLGALTAVLAGRVGHGDAGALTDVTTEVSEAPTGPVALRANGLQQGLLYHSLRTAELDGGTGDDAYVMQSVHHYRCALRPELMREAWQHARRRYPSLRLSFDWSDEPVQVVADDDEPVDWRYVDLGDIADPAQRAARITDLQQRDRTERYDPATGRLFRVYLVREHDELFTLIFSCHHIILDGWSLPVLHDEVHRTYLRLARGLPVRPGHDDAYLAAQRHWAAHRGDHVGYWTDRIARIDERGDLTGLLNEASRYRVSLSDYDHVRTHRTRRLGLGADLTRRLTAVCAEHGVTLHSVLQFVWHKTLHTFGGGNTTVVGTIVSGRNLPVDAVEDSVGLFINTLPLIVEHDAQATLPTAEAIAQVQDTVTDMAAASVVELGGLEGGGMKRRLFDTLLVLENYPRLLAQDEVREHSDLLRFEKAYDADKVDYPIAVVAREEDDELAVTLWYAGELFDDDTIDTVLAVTRTLFEQVAENPTRAVRDLELVAPDMVELLDSWNRTEVDFDTEATLHGIFRDMAARWPDEPAVVFRDRRLSYRELDELTDRMAHHLLDTATLRPNDVVALLLDKNELMMAAIIAVWKTGAALVPIDPGYPDDRVEFMLTDTDARIVLTNDRHAARVRELTDDARPVCEIEHLPLHRYPATPPDTTETSTDLAYAIYTSGTTGRPKAVLVEHQGVVNLQRSLGKLFGLRKDEGDEALLSFSNYIFDHFYEYFTDALLNGQKLVVLDDDLRGDAEGLYRYIRDEQVTYLSGTPSVLSLYDYSTATTLRRVDAIGEDFTEPVFAKIRGTFGGLIINGYGPTEVSITSHKRPYPPDVPRVNKSIGLPVQNITAYVLTDAMKRVPVGGIGELYLGGIGVTRGYLNRDDLTAYRFVDNPYQSEQERAVGANARIYKTGDLARWLPNGEVEYLGRTDLQVKIRGLRIELGEVEAALTSHPAIRRSLVVAREFTGAGAGQKYLVAFYLTDTDDLDEQDLKAWMRRTLPESVVPARVIRITDIPVTPSGKLDATRLPQTQFGDDTDGEYTAPSDDVEIKLCGIWSAVLGVAPELIGAHADFFALGGDSIRAMALAQAITTGFGRGLGVGTVLRNTTLAEQAEHIRRAGAEPGDTGEPATARTVVGNAPVSPAQERLLFIDDFEGGTDAYNIPFALRVETDELRTAATIADAVRTVVRRHPALRTLLRTDPDGVRRQHPLPVADVAARFPVPTSRVPDAAARDALLVERAGHVFALAEVPPLVAELVEVADEPGVLYLSLVVHHSAFDGWSWDLVRGELAHLLDGGSEAELPAVRGDYGDFACWQRQYLTGQRLDALTEFWTDTLAGFETVRLPLDRQRPPRFDHRGRELTFAVDATTTAALRELARASRVSLYSVLLGAWSLLLSTYTGQRDLVVGTPSANRGRPEFAGVVGFFANLLALRVQVDPRGSLREHLRAVGERVLAAQVHGELPFEQLVKELDVRQDPSRHPVLQINFTLQNVTDRTRGTRRTTGGDPVFTDHVPDAGGATTTKFDLSATLTEGPDGLAGNLTYAAALFDDATVRGYADAYARLLAKFAEAVTGAKAVGAGDIVLGDLVGAVDSGDTVEAGTDTDADTVAPARHLAEVFEAVVAATPDAPALVCGETVLTYRQLDERANRLAHQLRRTVVPRPGELIGLVVDRTENSFVAILAVWKAGAAYLPIDPGAPDDRIAFMLADTDARAVLADPGYVDRVRSLPGAPPVVPITTVALTEGPTTRPDVAVTADDLAYAIYTSGTTGRPKAVLVAHRSVDGFRAHIAERYFGPAGEHRQTVLAMSHHVFDFSVEQYALSLLGGHTLLLPPASGIYDRSFHDHANRHGLSYVSGTPTQIQRLDLGRLTELRCVLAAGEALHAHHMQAIRRGFDGPLYNAYGTTETTVYNTVHRFAPGEPHRNTLGEPLGNTRLHVLDADLRPLPDGAVGELYLAGDCVTEGYRNRPELTAERFLDNPHRSAADRAAGRAATLYRTGDLVRRTSTGDLQYHGRDDAQVKINGLRIELGEVQAVLADQGGVRECAVAARVDPRTGDTRLVGYYVPDDGPCAHDALRSGLRTRLMPSMVPSLLVAVDDALPMTVNGKLDLDALPAVDFDAARREHTVPRDRVEARLCRLWAAHGPGAAVGIDDDFFRIGGDSIAALHLTSRVQRELGRPISVKDVFDHPTVRGFVENVLATREPTEPAVVGEDRPVGECPLLPIQEWFLAKPLPEPGHWNQTFAITVPELDVATLRDAIGRLAEHHDVFRLRYPGSGTPSRQEYTDGAAGVELHELDVRDLDDQAITRWLTERQRFDLDRGPIACAAYLHGFADGSARVWFAVHHLAIDTVSWQLLTGDLEILYHGGDLGPRGASYRQWVRAVGEYDCDEQRALWAGITDAMAASAQGLLPVAGTARHRAEFTLDAQRTETLLTESAWAYDTGVDDLLLTAVGMALHAVTGRTRHHVTVEGHGRESFDGAPDVRDTAGWFTTMHPLLLEPGDDADPAAAVARLRDLRARIPDHGLGYGALFGYDTDKHPLPPVAVNYLGRLDDPTGSPTTAWLLDPGFCGADVGPGAEHGDRTGVDITMSVVGGRLVAAIDGRVGAATVDAIGDRLQAALHRVIEHTAAVAGDATGPVRSTGVVEPGAFEPYVLVNEEITDPGRTLFVLPPGEGGAESYLGNVARRLPGHRLVLFNNVHLHEPMASFEDIARYYLEHVRALVPSGPYRFLGWSFGGVLALEMSAQLAAVGERIDDLVIVDSYFDVPAASAAIGLGEVPDILDPINFHYRPDAAHLAGLRARLRNLVMFRAEEPNDIVRDEQQRQLFEYYRGTPHHHLDTLLGVEDVETHVLRGETHHSWVRNDTVVAALCDRVLALSSDRNGENA